MLPTCRPLRHPSWWRQASTTNSNCSIVRKRREPGPGPPHNRRSPPGAPDLQLDRPTQRWPAPAIAVEFLFPPAGRYGKSYDDFFPNWPRATNPFCPTSGAVHNGVASSRDRRRVLRPLSRRGGRVVLDQQTRPRLSSDHGDASTTCSLPPAMPTRRSGLAVRRREHFCPLYRQVVVPCRSRELGGNRFYGGLDVIA